MLMPWGKIKFYSLCLYSITSTRRKHMAKMNSFTKTIPFPAAIGGEVGCNLDFFFLIVFSFLKARSQIMLIITVNKLNKSKDINKLLDLKKNYLNIFNYILSYLVLV